mgnify:CR=1 FL=1
MRVPITRAPIFFLASSHKYNYTVVRNTENLQNYRNFESTDFSINFQVFVQFTIKNSFFSRFEAVSDPENRYKQKYGFFSDLKNQNYLGVHIVFLEGFFDTFYHFRIIKSWEIRKCKLEN